MSALDHHGRPRVAVTGIGVKTPAGTTVDAMWEGLCRGESTAAPITGFDNTGHPVSYACETAAFDPDDYFDTKEARRTDRVSQLGLAAAVDALAQAGGAAGPIADPARCAVVAGTGIGGIATLESQVGLYGERGASRVSPLLVPMMMPNATAALIAMRHGWLGANLCIATACAAGAHAIGEGARLIRDGSADVVAAGGSEAAVTPVALAAFARMGALSTADDAKAASRPFDVDRDGFVMGEGAAFLVLESWEHAVRRDAPILGEIRGYGRTCDAFHITAPSPGGAGAVACMIEALNDAGLAPAEIGHVNAHGTSTPLNDASEAEAIAKVFDPGSVPVTSTKGVTGHLIGAAGAVEAVAALLAAAHGRVPPTANHQRADEDMQIDVVAGSARPVEPAPALSNSFGFGGHNAALVVAPGPTER